MLPGKNGPKDVLSPLCTDCVVVKSTAIVQCHWAELRTGAGKKAKVQRQLLCWPGCAPWESHSASLGHTSSPNLVLKSSLPPPPATSAAAMIFSIPPPCAKGIQALGRCVLPHTLLPQFPHGPGPYLWKALQQHWYTSKLVLLRVLFRRDTQSTSAPLGT